MAIPNKMTTIFLRLKECPSELSNKITVAMCKRTPMTKAVRALAARSEITTSENIKLPKGVITENMAIIRKACENFIRVFIKNILKIRATVILWTTIP
jgi:hypothetical protein